MIINNIMKISCLILASADLGSIYSVNGQFLPKLFPNLFSEVENKTESNENLPWGELISDKLFFFLSKCPSGAGEIRLIFYSRSIHGLETKLESLDKVPVDSSFQTIFLIHGFLHRGTVDWLNKTVTALLENKRYNIFVVDWRNGACAETVEFTNLHVYSSAAANTKIVGNHVASCIESLCENHSVRLKDVWLIGHSLGAHVSGFAGKSIYADLGKKLGRITALDPAGPLFTELGSDSRLDKSDAIFVEALHSSGILGLQDAIGDIDIYYNGGIFQSSCLLEILADPACSHGRAIEYYVEAIKNPGCHFIAKAWSRSTGYNNATSTRDDSCTVAGPYATVFPARGTFYVQTNDQAPYCTGRLPTTGFIIQIPFSQIGIDPTDNDLLKFLFPDNKNL